MSHRARPSHRIIIASTVPIVRRHHCLCAQRWYKEKSAHRLIELQRASRLLSSRHSLRCRRFGCHLTPTCFTSSHHGLAYTYTANLPRRSFTTTPAQHSPNSHTRVAEI